MRLRNRNRKNDEGWFILNGILAIVGVIALIFGAFFIVLAFML